MKIMQVIGSLGNGGAEKLAVELSNELSINNEVFLVSFNSFEKDMVFLRMINSKVKVVSLKRKQISVISFYRKLHLLIKEIKPDIIHLHLDITLMYFSPLIILDKLLLSQSVKYYYTIHNNLVVHNHEDSEATNYSNSRLFDFLNKFICIPINFICISKVIQTKFSSRYNNLEFGLIENGTNKLVTSSNSFLVADRIASYKTDKDTKVLISVGRINTQKNYNLAIEVMQKLKKKNIILIIVGNEKTVGKPLLKSLLSKSPSNVFFERTVENVADYLKSSDAFLLTSFYEGMPISILEAMSFGLPIITTPAGGVVDMIKDEINGYITSDFKTNSLVKKIDTFLSLSDNEIEKISDANASIFKSEYSMEKCTASYLKLYESQK